MVHKAALAFPLLGLSLLVSAGPLQQREATPDWVDEEVGYGSVEKLYYEIIGGQKPAVDSNKEPKPETCGKSSKDKCCVCMLNQSRVCCPGS